MSLVSHENIEIFVVIHEKAIQRSLKNERETKSPEKSFILTAEERKQICVAPRFHRRVSVLAKNLPALLHPKDAGKLPLLVEGSLEDESDIALLTSQLLGTEGAGGVEGVSAVRQWDLTPEGCRLL